MMINIYNTLTKTKMLLSPIEAGHIKFYACGMTVYDYCHIGHARAYVAFDMIMRYLRYREYRVTYVRNITDIDDKIIQRALENGEDYQQLTARFIQAMDEDFAKLDIVPPDLEPRATEHISHIIEMIQTLLDKGVAYRATNGDVYYDISSAPAYGKLSGRKQDDLQAGERVEVNPYKRSALDFVLWKAAKPDEPQWPSPFGDGRPGWHIECSAMSKQCLGDMFDIHGGGQDLIFPHHENEIAQSESANEKPFVNIWMHIGSLLVNNEKMSKSLGNYFTIRDVLAIYSPEVLRYFFLSSHYRSPINYSHDGLESAHASLSRLYTALRGIPIANKAVYDAYEGRFQAAMDEDFNTANALAVLFDMAKEVNRLREQEALHEASQIAAGLKRLGSVLGLLQMDPETFFQQQASDEACISGEAIERLMAARQTAREEKNWQEADRIRDVLLSAGVVLEDSNGKTTWRRV